GSPRPGGSTAPGRRSAPRSSSGRRLARRPPERRRSHRDSPPKRVHRPAFWRALRRRRREPPPALHCRRPYACFHPGSRPTVWEAVAKAAVELDNPSNRRWKATNFVTEGVPSVSTSGHDDTGPGGDSAPPPRHPASVVGRPLTSARGAGADVGEKERGQRVPH